MPSFALIGTYEMLMRQVRQSAAGSGKPQQNKPRPQISRREAPTGPCHAWDISPPDRADARVQRHGSPDLASGQGQYLVFHSRARVRRNDGLSISQISQTSRAIAGALGAYGGAGCAGAVAQEFGDHPEIAATRMRWARAEVPTWMVSRPRGYGG